ncbi:hypothetical protein GGR56DRAFT_10619 [Xylariaceae sp. FL0804]|nr:hypothetical protein GGR56DRAFT_10619 [Xylariaceae sp. FL0804]
MDTCIACRKRHVVCDGTSSGCIFRRVTFTEPPSRRPSDSKSYQGTLPTTEDDDSLLATDDDGLEPQHRGNRAMSVSTVSSDELSDDNNVNTGRPGAAPEDSRDAYHNNNLHDTCVYSLNQFRRHFHAALQIPVLHLSFFILSTVFLSCVIPFSRMAAVLKLCSLSVASHHFAVCRPQDVSLVKYGTFLSTHDDFAQTTGYSNGYSDFPTDLERISSKSITLATSLRDVRFPQGRKIASEFDKYKEDLLNASIRFRKFNRKVTGVTARLITYDMWHSNVLDEADDRSLLAKLFRLRRSIHSLLIEGENTAVTEIKTSFRSGVETTLSGLREVDSYSRDAQSTLLTLKNRLDTISGMAASGISAAEAAKDFGEQRGPERKLMNLYGLLSTLPDEIPLHELLNLRFELEKDTMYADNGLDVLGKVISIITKLEKELEELTQSSESLNGLVVDANTEGLLFDAMSNWIAGLRKRAKTFQDALD